LSSRGGGTDDASYISYATFNRWNGERYVNVYRHGIRWDSDCRFAGVRNSLHFSPRFGGAEFFASCPFQPPSILPISPSTSESANIEHRVFNKFSYMVSRIFD